MEWNLKYKKNGMKIDSFISYVWLIKGMESIFGFLFQYVLF